jgi:putative ABC transport system permease protein
MLPRQINASETLAAASPSFEMARLLSFLRPLTVAASGLGILLVIIAAVGAAVGLMATMNARTRDLALLRALGASRAKLAGVAFAEAALIAGAALVLGALLAFGLLVLCSSLLLDRTGLLLQPQIGVDQIALVIGGTILVTIVAAAFPALRASHAEIEELLLS